MKKIFYFLILNILLLIPFNVHATSCIKGNYIANISLEKENIYVGDNIHFKINSNVFFKTTYTSANEFIKVEDGVIKAFEKGEGLIDITIDFLVNNEVKDSCTTTIPVTIKEPIVSLEELTLKEYDLKDIFKSDVYNYEITLPYQNESINILATPLSENSKVTGDGEKTLNVGLNEFKIIVEEGSETLTYTLSIIREEGSKDATLKSLIVEGYLLNPKFKENNYNYQLEVGKDINDIYIKAIPNDSKAEVKGTGRFDLTTGQNNFSIIVVAEDGTTKTYHLNVNKNKGSSSLNNLTIEGYNLDTPFQSDKYTYFLEVASDITEVKINAKANEEDQVEILNNDTLNYGKNNILIRVTSPDKTTTTYKLVITRLNANSQKIIITNVLFYLFLALIVIVIILISIFIKRNLKNKNVKKISKRK